MINKNKLFRQIHIYLSLFFLPCAVIYAITGVGYIFDFDDKAGMTTQSYTLQSPANSNEQMDEKQILFDFLKQNNLALPDEKEVKVKNTKPDSIALGNLRYSVMMNKIDENRFEITTQKRSLYGIAVLLHKDKGAWYFATMSAGFGLCLLMLYISGLIITFFTSKKDRNKQLGTFVAGLLVTLILAYLSI